MLQALSEGWAELQSLPEDPTAEDVYRFVGQVAEFQGLFKPGRLQVSDCQVVQLEPSGEEYHGTLLARQITTPGVLARPETVVVRARFRRAPRGRDESIRYDCTHLSIGLVRVTNGIVKDRGHGLDITYSAFVSTKNVAMRRVRIRDFPNNWRRALRAAVLAKLLDWRLEQYRSELSRCQGDLERANQALAHRGESNS